MGPGDGPDVVGEDCGSEVGGGPCIQIDIDREDYPGAVPMIGEKLRPEGVLVADNVL